MKIWSDSTVKIASMRKISNFITVRIKLNKILKYQIKISIYINYMYIKL